MNDRKFYRIKFSKFDEVRFIGHLDLLRLFQKVIKLSKLPIAYSQGFNPHQLISFALPLSLGLESRGDYADIILTEEVGAQAILDSLVFPHGIEILGAKPLVMHAKTAASVLRAAKYEIICDFDAFKHEIFLDLHDKNEILVMKKSKTKTVEVNIRPMIFDIYKENGAIFILVSAGSDENLKPELILNYLGIEEFRLIRVEMYEKIDDQFIPLI